MHRKVVWTYHMLVVYKETPNFAPNFLLVGAAFGREVLSFTKLARDLLTPRFGHSKEFVLLFPCLILV